MTSTAQDGDARQPAAPRVRRRLRGPSLVLGIAGLALAGLAVVATLASATSGTADSTCFGTTGSGRLERGVALPRRGPNFTCYSAVGSLAGRTHVHSRVRAAVVAAYARLETSAPGAVYVYGETGWPKGGRFRPHRTHQNGLSVDFMVPVKRGLVSTPLPCSATNKYGYALEFDATGRCGDLVIDWEAMALHLLALDEAARVGGFRIARVIFDPVLQPRLLGTPSGARLRSRMAFSTKPAWIRHDEHYHVDFAIDCEALTPP